MSELKHTPTPWHYQEESDAYTHIIRGPRNEFIASGPQDSSGRTEADVRFIVECVNAARASSPDPAREALVGALKDCMEYIEQGCEGFFPECMLKAERALAEQGHKGATNGG